MEDYAAQEAAAEQRQREEKAREKEELLRALSVLALRTSKDWTTYSQKPGYFNQPDHELVKYTYRDIIKFALSEKADTRVECIARLHRNGRLKAVVDELKHEKKLGEIPEKLISDLLEIASPKIVNYPDLVSRSPLRLFDPKKEKVALGAAVGAGVGILGLGGLVTAFTFMSLASTTISSSTVAMAAVGTAAAAGTVFPPLGIALLAISGAMLLAAAIILIAMTIHHNRQMNKSVDDHNLLKHRAA